jgi:hypothetical protein
MSDFWGYTGADVLALIVISSLSALALYHARIFVSRM